MDLLLKMVKQAPMLECFRLRAVWVRVESLIVRDSGGLATGPEQMVFMELFAKTGIFCCGYSVRRSFRWY